MPQITLNQRVAAQDYNSVSSLVTKFCKPVLSRQMILSTTPGTKARFEKVGECLYRNSSNGDYYASLKQHGKQKRVSLRTTGKSPGKAKACGLPQNPRTRLSGPPKRPNGPVALGADPCAMETQVLLRLVYVGGASMEHRRHMMMAGHGRMRWQRTQRRPVTPLPASSLHRRTSWGAVPSCPSWT